MNSENSTATRTWVARIVGGPYYPDEKCVTSAWAVVASVHAGLPIEGARTPTSCAQDSRHEESQGWLPRLMFAKGPSTSIELWANSGPLKDC